MRKTILASISLIALAIASNASAADLKPVYKAQPTYVEQNNWTGFYVGGEFEISSGVEKITQTPWAAEFPKTKFNGSGGGVFVGYTRQFQNNMTLGLESAWAWPNQTGSNSKEFCAESYYGHCYGKQTDTHRVTLKGEGSTQIRLGYAIDRLHFGVSGGVSYGWMEENNKTSIVYTYCPPWSEQYTAGHALLGYAVGAFAEYAVTNNFAITLKYTHSDMTALSTDWKGFYNNHLVGHTTTKVGVTDDSFRVGAKWKFNI